jgi:rubrerythrin
VSSNIAQNYPYSSESEGERAASLARTLADHEGLEERVKAESLGLPEEGRRWVWRCPTRGCCGLLHEAGFARNARAVYAVCDTCGMTYLR